MYYTVTARLKPFRAAELYENLTDGTLETQKPDGEEIVASMKRARISQDGTVQWSEVCHCQTPLQHERETVYDRFFEDIQTEAVEDYVEFKGQDFMEHLADAGKT